MAESRLSIIIDATAGDARGELSALQKDLKATGTIAEGASAQQVGANKRAGMSLTELKSGLDLATGAFKAVQGAVQSVIDPVIQYADEVSNLARQSGVSVEAASTLIQVADDLKVSYDTLKMAAKEMNENGTQPTIANIKLLATEYQALDSPVAKAQFATDKFGRSGIEMAKLLEQPIERLDELAQSAKDAGLVLDEQAVASARAAEVAFDDFEDSVMGAKIALSEELIPAATDVVTQGASFIQYWSKSAKAIREGELSLLDFQKAGYQVIFTDKTLAGAVDDLTASLEPHNRGLAVAAQMNDMMTGSQQAAIPVIVAEAGAYGNLYEQVQRQTKYTEEHELKAIADLEAAYVRYTQTLSGPLDDEFENFKTSQDEIRGKLGEVTGAIDVLNSMPYLSDEQRTELEELKTKQAELRGEFAQTATAHEAATKRILLDMITQRLGFDGFSGEEIAGLQRLAGQWGLTGDVTMATLGEMDKKFSTSAIEAGLSAGQIVASGGLVADSLLNTVGGAADQMPEVLRPAVEAFEIASASTTGWIRDMDGIPRTIAVDTSPAVASLDEASGRADYFTTRLDRIPREVRVSVITDNYQNYHGYTIPGTGGGAAAGADFIVPPGFPNDSFPLRVQSGEHVMVTPAGQDARRDAGNTYNYHTHIHDQLAAALYTEQMRQREMARHDMQM